MGSDGSDLYAQRADLLRYVGRRVDDPALREDIVQEAYLRLLTYQAKPDANVTNVVAFLRRISINLVRDYFRRSGRGMATELSEDLPCPRSDLESQAEQRQLIVIVAGVLGRMPGLRREVFIARRLHGASAREVAERLGISPGAVDTHVARAVLDLHRAMATLEKRGASAGR
ncbi:RNA polymerase sigma factor [Sphingomonas colocasiae]|uniref:RNA polymerase sigma factor n=1 Tax=Sphingomonas colocasiae TaxID=1848973 RepID=A0ABS7PSV2_9SPHN|nr:RNA polymerase sigma factor [Sphingomonas colocasiae]MBY8824368.1 RNA polymerase sigma factor [Sphingomonas colocasiae]